MKNTIILLFTCIIILMMGCKNNLCNGVVTYQKLDTRLTGYIFNPGSYWVYYDSIDGIRDSQYVYSYSHRIHYRNPADTPNHLYLVSSPGGQLSDVYCGPYYLDTLSMSYVSYRNGIFADTLALGAGGGIALYIIEHYNQPNQISIYCFQLDFTQIGLLAGTMAVTSPADTSAVWYRGVVDTLVEGNYTFNNVNTWGIQIGTPRSTRFVYPTDLYFASGYGIVKIIEHRPTGDVPWVLLNYHISN